MGKNNERIGITQRHWIMWHNINNGHAWLDSVGDRFFYTDPNGQNELTETDVEIITLIDNHWWEFREANPEDAKNIEELAND